MYYTNRKNTNEPEGILCNPPPKEDPMAAMANPDMSQAAGMMKSQMVFIVSQGMLGYW